MYMYIYPLVCDVNYDFTEDIIIYNQTLIYILLKFMKTFRLKSHRISRI